METKGILIGEYKQSGNKLFMGDRVLLIRERKQDTKKKPKNYLMELEPEKGYISSLFPIGDHSFSFDFESEIYRLELKEEQAVISKQ